MTTQRVTFTQRGGDGAGFFYLLASGGATGSINFDFTTGSLPAGITFTRASIGTYVNAAGTLITASNNVARFNYVAGVANLLIEDTATNLFLQSNNFSNAVWNVIGGPIVITAAQFISPDGTNNGWSIDNGTSSSAGIYESILYTNVPYVVSLWSKQISANTSTQLTIAGTNSGSITTTATLTRKSYTRTPAAGSSFSNINSVGVSPSLLIGIFGAQIELGSAPTSYIPTTTAAVTRAADSAVFTIPSGVGHLTYTFDDNSTQLVTVSAGSYTIPTTLNRPNIKSIVGSA